MRLPQFTAPAVLHHSRPKNLPAAGRRHPQETTRPFVEPAAIIQDGEGNSYSCRPLYTEGTITYLDCRRLDGDVVVPPGQPPGHCWTETNCVLGAQFCRDRCISAGGGHIARDWYYCGICFGSPIAQRPAAALAVGGSSRRMRS